MTQGKTKKPTIGSRHPKLDGSERVARKARNIVWEQGGSFVRRAWIPLLAIFAMPFVSSLAFAMWWLKGSGRWFFLGVSSISCVWLIFVLVILWSGIGPTIMGIQGESMTADTLRGFRKNGWTLINGLRFPDSGDIDHILVGPAGVFIFETKWSSARWPMRGERWPYITNQLNWAISQVKRNRDDIAAKIAIAQKYIPIYAVCVLWSAADSTGDPTSFQSDSPDYVYGVKGRALDEWLKQPRRNVLNSEEAELVASQLSQLAIISDIESKESYRRTLTQILMDSVLFPILGLMAPIWIEGLIALTKNAYLDLAGLVLLGGVGVYIRMRTRLKIVTVCWFASLGMMVTYLLVHQIHFLFNRN